MENNILEKRMYSLVLYNISPIQAGIQSAHSNMEYMNDYANDEDFQDWAKKWKTVILLNGGTSNNGSESFYGYTPTKGSMETHLSTLIEYGIKVAPFYEPDLNYCLTSMSFIVDERVFDKIKYPYPIDDYDMKNILALKTFQEVLDYVSNLIYVEKFKDFINSIGGEKNLFLRWFLKDFKLSNN